MRRDRFIELLCEAVKAKLQKKQILIPAGGDRMWWAFADLSRARSWHRFGPNPISFTEIEAWARLTRTPLEPHHVKVIQAMDWTFLEDFSSVNRDAPPDGVKSIPRGSDHPLSPALFDLAVG